jgi:hypothetical protein
LKRRLFQLTEGLIKLPTQQPLLQTCRQICAEAEEIYLTLNNWVILLNLDKSIVGGDMTSSSSNSPISTALNAMRAWVSDMGGLPRFRNLRTVKIIVACMCSDGTLRAQGVQVKLENARGLTVRRPPNHGWLHEFRREDFLGWFTASTEMRRKQRGWLGEGIMDFLLGSEELWSEMRIHYTDDEYGDRRIMSDPID